MQIDLEKFKAAYDKSVEESLPDYRAGNMKEIVKKYPLIGSEDVPWTRIFTPLTYPVPAASRTGPPDS